MADAFGKTYKITRNGPKPMAWPEYERQLKQAWQDLLGSNPTEPVVQSFLEKHPCLLPGFRTMTGSSGHGPFPDAVISQPPLAAIGKKVPDFMWLSKDSLVLEPVLIEIERPSKRWFT
jgi:hypothetical protein